jgi:hypothetical protein
LGKADQQDPYILSRMPGVKPPITHFKDPADQAKAKQMGFPATAPAVTPTAVTPTAVTPTAVTPTAVTPTADADKEAKVKRFTELLTKAGVMTAPPATTAVDPQLGNYNLAPATASAPGIKLPPAAPIKEGIVFKSKIGHLLAEEFGVLQGLKEAPAQPASALSKEEYSELSKLYGDLSVTYKDDAQLAPLFTAYNKVPPTWNSTTPPPVPNTQNPTPPKPTAKGHPSIGKLQDFLNKKGATSNDGKPLTIDNLFGQKSSEAQDNFYKKYPANAPERAELDAIIKAIPKEWSNKFVGNKTTPPPTIAQKANPKATADTVSPELDTTGSLANPPVAPGTVPVDQLTKAMPTPKSGDTYWINGNRYRYQVSGGGRGFAGSAKWVYDYGQEKPETMGGITSNQTTFKRLDKYTGIGESTGYSDDELNRLISLVHHR